MVKRYTSAASDGRVTPIVSSNQTIGKTTRTNSLSGSSSFFKSFALTLAIIFAGIGGVWGQAANYNYSASSGTYTEITGGTVVSTTTWDDNASTLITIPSFVFNGTAVTKMSISSNGWITVGGTAATTSTTIYTPLSSAITATGATGVICPFGSDLWCNGVGVIRWQTVGSETIIQWKGLQTYVSGGNGSNLNFQIRLNHTTNSVSFVYGTMTRGTGTANPVVGIKSGLAAGVIGTTQLNLTLKDMPSGTTCLSWSNAVRGRLNSENMLFTSATPVSTLSSGTTFTFTPQSGITSTWVAPVTVTAAPTSITGTGATINWTVPALANRCNLQYRKAADCAWTNFSGNPITVTASSTATTSLTGLTAATVYHVRVQPFVNGGNTAGYSHIFSTTAGTNTDGYVATGSFTTLSPPTQPSAIVGTLDAEPGSSQTYSVTNVASVTYTWSFPATWTITAGQNSNSVTVTVGTQNGTISVTPSNTAGDGTARTATTTIPNYRWKYISSNLGSATWTGGEARNVSITIKNTGVATWNTGSNVVNVGVKWNPWSDYHVRTTVGSLASGATQTYSLPIEARNQLTTSTVYGGNLADGSYTLVFDMVTEGCFWFGNNPGTVTCNAASVNCLGNSVFTSATQTVSTVPTLSCSALTAFGNVCTNSTPTNSFTISGVNLTNSVSVGSVTGYKYSTASNGSYTSTLTLTPSSGSLNQTVYVQFTPTAATAYSGSISVTSAGATGQSVSVSGTGITAPTVNAGSDFNMCSGQTIAMSGSTNATSSSGTASSGTVTASGNDNTNPTATYTFTGLPSGALINGITVNITSAGGVNCPSWYGVTTRLNGVQQGVAGCATNTTYTNLNGQAANGLVIAVRGQNNDGFVDAMTITYTVSLNYTVPPTYSWSPATGLSATNILTPDCSATSTTTYTLTVTGTNGCSASDAVAVTVAGSAPSAPTASVSGSSTINVGGTATLTSSAGANTLWYEVATLGSSVGSGDNWQTPVQCVSGTKTYYAEDNNGTCASATRTAVTFTVRPIVVSNPANGLICQAGGSVTLSSQLTGGSSITWTNNSTSSTTSGSSTVLSPTATTVYTMSATVAGCSGSVTAQQTIGVIDAVAFTPTSTPTAVCAGNPAELASNLSSSNFSVGYTPSFSPIATPGTTNILFNGSTATYTTLSGGSLDDGGWANIPIGFSYDFFGQSFPSLAVGTNGLVMFGTVPGYGTTSGQLGQYSFNTAGGAFPNSNNPGNVIALIAHDIYLAYYQSSTFIRYWTQGIAPTRKFVLEFVNVPDIASGALSTAQLVLNETTGIVEIYVSSASAASGTSSKIIGLQNGAKTIGAVAGSNNNTPEWNYRSTVASNLGYKFVPGANYTFQWTTAGSNTVLATTTTYTTPNLSTAGPVTYSVAATNPNTQCTTTQSVEITVNALPAAPNSSGDVTACGNAGSQSLTVTTGTGVTADWYSTSSASTSPTILASGDNVLTYSTATAGTYYAEAQNTTTGCTSASRTGVTLNVNASPAAPTVTTPVSYCQGIPATTLTATPTGSNTLNWYSAAPSYPAVSGATALGSAPTPSTSTAGPTTYYVSQSSSSNNCESQLASITVTVNATPSTPVASNPAAYCEGAPASALTATATAGNTLYWYTHPTTNAGQTSTAPTPSTATAGTTDYYVANRNNTSSCEGSRATVTVTVNPTITASVSNSASSTSACGGGAITFTATPTNGGTPTYQWYLNNQPVGTNSATYTLAAPNNADAIYVAMTPSAQTCLASVAATNSNTVSLTAAAATPTVSIQSSATSAFCPGTPVTFSVNASANMGASPGYQWNLNGQPINGATNATLTTTTLANTNQVSLTMTSSLSGGCLTQSNATSSAITSAVNSATVISVPPAAASACLGGTASFTVSATGTGTLTYQWKKNGSNVNGNASATTSTLTLSGIAAGDAANYTVDVIGTCGTVSSTAVALTINSATAISAQPSAITQCAGTTANFSVTASGQGTLSYQWKKDGSNVGTNSSTLSITNIALANAGQYSVIVTGGCGNVTSSNALLTVNSSTAISTQPVASTLCAGNTVNFSVTASGTGTLSYQWKKDGTNVGTNSSSLSIANTQAANAGAYTVDVIGSCGTLTSNNALLTVNPLTSISTQPVATSGCQGQNTTFSVVAAGSGTLSYQWKFGATNVGTNSSSYNIPSTSNANDGNYSVVVTGGCGNITSNTVALNVYASPSIAASITTSDFTSTAMCGVNQVSITAASIGNDSQAEWTVVGSSSIVVDDPMSTTITATAANSALGGSVKKLVWEVSRVTSGTTCYSRDTISIDFKQPVITPISSVVATGDLLWGGLTSTTWGTSSNWYELQNDGTASAWIKLASGQPGASSKTYTLANSVAGSCVSALNAPALATAGSTSSVYIGTGANLNLNAGNLTIEGNLVNNGTITPGNGTVTFTGTSAQTISGTGTVSDFNNLVVNKASGTLTLSQPARVTGTLTMTQGDIVSDATNILEIGTSASSVGSVSWASGTVRGPMKRWFATSTNSTQASGVFPVGANVPGKGVINRYAQVNFTSAPGAGGYVIAEYKTGTPSTGYTGLPLTYNSNQYIQNYEEEGYWDITPYNTEGTAYAALNTAPYTLKLRMNNPSTLQAGLPPSGSNGNVIADISKLRIITSKGPSHNTWILAGTQGSGHVVLGTGDYLLEETGVTGFSFFNGGGNDNNPLPVELLNFNGTCEEGMVNLVWQTASEFNSSHFDVEKSTDGETWRVLATVPSAGTSNELLTYQAMDNSGTTGSNYYRLRQVDNDGKEKLYDPINVSCVETSAGYFTSYPNPSGNEFQVVVNNKEILGACTLNIVDAQGKVIDQRSIEVKEGINMFVISETLNPGIYFLNITNGTKTTQVIKHAVK